MPLKYLWGIINQVQLIEFLLLICVNKPYPLKLVFKALSFVNGDFILIRMISSAYSSGLPAELLRDSSPCFKGANVDYFSVFKNMEHSVWVGILYFILIYPLILTLFFLFRRFKW